MHFSVGCALLLAAVLSCPVSNADDGGKSSGSVSGAAPAHLSKDESAGVSKAGYLDLMEAAVRAYSGERLASYLDESDRDGVQEHGFPRLAANMSILVANGRLPDRREFVRKMMDVCCRDAPKGKMPPRSGGNEFSVKELAIAIVELERHGMFPKEVTDRWRGQLRRVDAMRCYRYAEVGPGELRGRNWQLFASSSEQARLRYGMGGDAGYVETYVADQSRWFDSNGLYRDPNQPFNYDFVSRIEFANILHDGYDGPARAELEKHMDLAAEPTLKMLSACGEIPYGGRSNQFLLNNTLYSSLCEWYAVRCAKRGDMKMAKEFRRAALESINALRPWLADRPVSHVKNRYPRKTGKAVYSDEADIGCERYAYFDKYMITMGSWAMLGWYFVDETIPAAPFTPAKPEVFLASPTFHAAFMRAGEYSAQFDYWANEHYDCNGLGRIHRRGAPAALCISVPCPRNPDYRLPEPNVSSLAIRPVAAENAEWRILHEARTDRFCLTDWKVGDLEWECRLSADGMEMDLSGNGAVAMELPAFDFDGRESAKITHDGSSISVSHQGWVCRYSTDGRMEPTGAVAHNRNGRYRVFRATGMQKLTVRVSIERRLQDL